MKMHRTLAELLYVDRQTDGNEADRRFLHLSVANTPKKELTVISHLAMVCVPVKFPRFSKHQANAT
jgi:hypothetical protein